HSVDGSAAPGGPVGAGAGAVDRAGHGGGGQRGGASRGARGTVPFPGRTLVAGHVRRGISARRRPRRSDRVVPGVARALMRWVRLFFRAFGWLLTPFMAWAASFFGCVAGEIIAARLASPGRGLLLSAACGALAGF